jgi:hypothetical protein
MASLTRSPVLAISPMSVAKVCGRNDPLGLKREAVAINVCQQGEDSDFR